MGPRHEMVRNGRSVPLGAVSFMRATRRPSLGGIARTAHVVPGHRLDRHRVPLPGQPHRFPGRSRNGGVRREERACSTPLTPADVVQALLSVCCEEWNRKALFAVDPRQPKSKPRAGRMGVRFIGGRSASRPRHRWGRGPAPPHRLCPRTAAARRRAARRPWVGIRASQSRRSSGRRWQRPWQALDKEPADRGGMARSPGRRTSRAPTSVPGHVPTRLVTDVNGCT